MPLLDSGWNPKVREGKVRKGKVTEHNITEDNLSECKTADAVSPDEPEDEAAAADSYSDLKFMTGKLGKGVVLLSLEQMDDLLDKLGLDGFDYYVEKLADYILRKQAKIKNHYATILKWWEEDRSVNI